MKNFKINYKLTISLVSLFISLLLIILGNKNKYCLSFGFILMGVSVGFYTLYKGEKFDEAIVEVYNDIEETEEQNEFELKQLSKELKKLTKQKKRFNFMFYFSAVLLIFVGGTFMF